MAELGFSEEEYSQLVVGWDNTKIVSPTDNCDKAMKLYSLNPPGITIEELREDCGKDAVPEGTFPQRQQAEKRTPSSEDSGVKKASVSPVATSKKKSYARMSQEYIDKLGLICDQIITGMQERAGNRLRSLANQPDLKPIRDAMSIVDPENVGVLPGVMKFARDKGETDETLFGSVLDKLRPQYERLTRATLKERNESIKEATGEDVDAQQDAERISLAWDVLAAGLIALARDRFFTATTEEQGSPEKPIAHSMPVGLLRKVAAVAGGADEAQSDKSSIATGPPLLTAYARVGLGQVGWRWEYGDPSTRKNPYEPHVVLDDRFSAVDLSNYEGMYPQDHFHCQCILEPVFEQEEN